MATQGKVNTMAIMTVGTLTRIKLNGVDVTEAFDNAALDMFADELNRKFDATMRETLTAPPTLRPVQASGNITFAVPEHLRYVLLGVRPAVPTTAPIRLCLWRRNLDDGNWRKRGHPAHRGC